MSTNSSSGLLSTSGDALAFFERKVRHLDHEIVELQQAKQRQADRLQCFTEISLNCRDEYKDTRAALKANTLIEHVVKDAPAVSPPVAQLDAFLSEIKSKRNLELEDELHMLELQVEKRRKKESHAKEVISSVLRELGRAAEQHHRTSVVLEKALDRYETSAISTRALQGSTLTSASSP